MSWRNIDVGWHEGMMTRKFVGFPEMSIMMLRVLMYMDSQQDDVGHLWLSLEDVHGHTIRALREHDWIVGSDGLDGRKYKITERGIKVMKHYSLPVEPRRYDGICPRCGENPVCYSESGNRHGYCRECFRKAKRRFRRIHPTGGRAEGQMCPDCGERERHVAPSGKIRTYCLPCRRERQKEYRKRKFQKRLERIEAGEFIACCKCGDKPVHYGETYVSDYCHDCFKDYMNEYNRKRRSG